MEDRLQNLKDIEIQRNDIITKLGKIEDKKHTVSAEVYEKVKKEYEDKLQALNSKMTDHIDLIKDQLKELDQEEQTIADSEKEINVHLEELELRFSIGEYSEEDYNSKKEEYESKLHSVKDKKQTLGERKSWLGNFVDIADKGTPAEQKPASGEAIPEEQPEEISAAELQPIKEEQPEEISDVELQPIKEEQSEEITAPELQPLEEAPAETPAEGIQIEEHILEEKLPEEDTKLDELIIEEDTISQPVEEPQSDTPPSEETVQEPAQPTEKEKAIACPKCNHLNTPDSWYCEKCGAEILDTPIS